MTDTDHAAWLEQRRTGIGGSDAPVLYGVHPWETMFSVWASKARGAKDEKGGWPLRLGKVLEPVTRDLYCEETGRVICDGVTNMRHPDPELGFMIANTDGTIQTVPDQEGPGVYEGKTTSVFNAAQWSEGVPLYYQIQVQHYLAVTGLRWGSLCVLILGDREPLRWVDIERNEQFIDDLVERERRFWHDHVLADSPPAPDGKEPTSQALKLLHPQDNGEIVQLGVEVHDSAERLSDIDDRMKELGQVREELRQQIKLAIGDATFGRFPDGTGFSWKTQDRKAYTVKASTSRVLRRASKKALAKAAAAAQARQADALEAMGVETA